jgi:hypothetical protein
MLSGSVANYQKPLCITPMPADLPPSVSHCEKSPAAVSHYETCQRVISGVFGGLAVADSLRHHGMAPATFYEKLDSDPELSEAYARAQRYRAELLADEVVSIADTEEDAGKARNRIMARQWYASKVNQGKWGDKLNIEVEQRVSLVDAIKEAQGRVLSASYQRITDEDETPATATLSLGSARDNESGDAPKPAENIDDLLG